MKPWIYLFIAIILCYFLAFWVGYELGSSNTKRMETVVRNILQEKGGVMQWVGALEDKVVND